MDIGDLMLKTPLPHIGYMPRSISLMCLTEKEADEYGYKKLQRIPRKITAYFDREKILKAYISHHARDYRDNYYLLVTTDKTIFIIEY